MASFHVLALICQPFSGGRGEGGMCPGRHFPGVAFQGRWKIFGLCTVI